MDEGAQNDPTVARLLGDLLQGAVPVDVGSFSLDADEAARKREQFQYPDRGRYLIPIFEGLHGLGATNVRVSSLGFDIDIEAEGLVLHDTGRALYLASTLAGRHDPDPVQHALGRIAVGIDMALGHGRVNEIAIEAVVGQQQFIAEYQRDKAVRVFRKEPFEGAAHVRILVDRSWARRKESTSEEAEVAELDELRSSIRHSILNVTISGMDATAVDRPLEYMQRGRGEGFSYELGLAMDGTPPSVVEIWSNGLRVDTIDAEGVGVLGELHVAQPRYDATRMGVVRTPAVEAGLEAVARGRAAALNGLRHDDEEWQALTRPLHWEVDRVDAVLGRAVHRTPTVFRTRILRAFMVGVTLLLGLAAAGSTVALLELLREGDGAEALIYLLPVPLILAAASAKAAAHLYGGPDSGRGKWVARLVFAAAVAGCVAAPLIYYS